MRGSIPWRGRQAPEHGPRSPRSQLLGVRPPAYHPRRDEVHGRGLAGRASTCRGARRDDAGAVPGTRLRRAALLQDRESHPLSRRADVKAFLEPGRVKPEGQAPLFPPGESGEPPLDESMPEAPGGQQWLSVPQVAEMLGLKAAMCRLSSSATTWLQTSRCRIPVQAPGVGDQGSPAGPQSLH